MESMTGLTPRLCEDLRSVEGFVRLTGQREISEDSLKGPIARYVFAFAQWGLLQTTANSNAH